MMKLVVFCALVAAASAAVVAPFAPLVYGSPFLAPYNNYRGPLSLAPGQPANILAADGRPLDTLDVNLDRSAHFVSKAFAGTHLLKKRSIAVAPLAPVVASRLAVAPAAPVIAPLSPYGLARVAPVAPIAPYLASPWITHW